MSDATSLLYDLPGFRVVSCALTALGIRQVVVMQIEDEHACPQCGVLVGGRPTTCARCGSRTCRWGTGRCR